MRILRASDIRTLFCLSILLVVCLPAAAADSYNIDPVHSAALFRVKRFNVVYVHGRFNEISGSFTLDENNLENSSVEIQIKTETVDSNNPRRDKHIKSPDFLNAKQFPVMTFTSLQIKQAADGAYEVTGKLNLHGATKPITAKVVKVGSGKDPRRGASLIGFEATLMFKRSEFGMKYMVGPLGDEVYVTMAIQGVGQ